jgi:hypothetical protein
MQSSLPFDCNTHENPTLILINGENNWIKISANPLSMELEDGTIHLRINRD